MPFDSFQPLGRNLTYRARQHSPFNNRQASNPNDTGCFQTAAAEIGITFADDLIKLRRGMMDLRRDHADQPVIIPAREFAQQKRGAQFASIQVGLRKSKQNDLP